MPITGLANTALYVLFIKSIQAKYGKIIALTFKQKSISGYWVGMVNSKGDVYHCSYMMSRKYSLIKSVSASGLTRSYGKRSD